MGEITIVWTDYFKYRVRLREFDLVVVEEILRHSTERYVDAVTGRLIVVGRDSKLLVVIPYEQDQNTLTPITIHSSNRQQINFRVKSGRYTNE